MNLEELKQTDYIIYEVIGGSHLYGTNIVTSDKDIRGVFRLPLNVYMGLSDPAGQIGDDKHDITYYSLKRIFELLLTANPNIIELLYAPADCILKVTPIMQKLIENRHLFITQKAYHSHSGYAFAQIKKATGQNKLINNPMPEEKPTQEDFCWVILRSWFDAKNNGAYDIVPARPAPLKATSINLKNYHVSALEHVSNTYRLYFYGDNAKGVFRGNGMLTCESIPLEDENNRFAGLLIYNEQEWQKALKKHAEYWDWIKNRNEARWIDQEKGKLDWDQKNMQHCIRLLMSGENILKYGEPIVRFTGDALQYLRDIRACKFTYDEILKDAEARMKTLDKLYEKSSLPWGVNMEKVDKLYRELSND